MLYVSDFKLDKEVVRFFNEKFKLIFLLCRVILGI
jgi:hypothetical protein